MRWSLPMNIGSQVFISHFYYLLETEEILKFSFIFTDLTSRPLGWMNYEYKREPAARLNSYWPSLICIFIHSLIHSFTFVHSLIHSFIRYIHPTYSFLIDSIMFFNPSILAMLAGSAVTCLAAPTPSWTPTPTPSPSIIPSTSPTPSPSPQSSSAGSPASRSTASPLCGQYQTANGGPFQLTNNAWGKDSASSGSQCTYLESTQGNSISWSASWSWNGGQNSVKSYPNVLLNEPAKQVKSISGLPTTWKWE